MTAFALTACILPMSACTVTHTESRFRLQLLLLPLLTYSCFMRLALGFDGGGTKTDCVLMDESGLVRARSQAGPSNPFRVGFGAAFASVRDSAHQALNEAHLNTRDVAALCAGLAGTGQPADSEKMRTLLTTEFPGTNVRICTD